MDLNFFALLVMAVALGVYIGKDPGKNLGTLSLFLFKTASIGIVWFIPLGVSFIVTFSITYSFFNQLNSSTTSPVPSFLIPIGSGFIGLIASYWVGTVIFNIKKQGLKKGLAKSWHEFDDNKKDSHKGKIQNT